MPLKASQRRRRTAVSGKKKEPIEIVVRRGAMRRFDALKTRTSELPVVVMTGWATIDTAESKGTNI